MMKTMKVVIFGLILACSTLSFPALAKADENNEAVIDVIMMPMYLNISSFSNDFYLSGTGMATLNSYLTIRNADTAVINVYLEKLTNGTWSSIASWTSTGYTGSTSINKTYQVPSKGQYRMRSSGFAYQGNTLLEMSSYVSEAWTY